MCAIREPQCRKCATRELQSRAPRAKLPRPAAMLESGADGEGAGKARNFGPHACDDIESWKVHARNDSELGSMHGNDHMGSPAMPRFATALSLLEGVLERALGSVLFRSLDYAVTSEPVVWFRKLTKLGIGCPLAMLQIK